MNKAKIYANGKNLH